MSNINEQKLARLFRECDTHQARMMSAYQKIQHKLPLQPASYLQLNEEDIILENVKETFGKNGRSSHNYTFVTLKLGLEAPASYTGDDWIKVKTPQK